MVLFLFTKTHLPSTTIARLNPFFEDLNKKLRRVMGANHPETVTNEKYLGDARERLRLRLIGDPAHAEH